MTQTAVNQPDTTAPDDGQEEGPVLLETLTDIELAVLGANGGAVVTPFLDSLETQSGTPMYDAITRTAFRGLLARGLIDMPTDDELERTQQPGSTEPVEIEVREDVVTVTSIRNNALALVAVARTTAVGQDFWYAHVIDKTVLIEEVGSDGLHRYVAVEADDLTEMLRLATIQPGAAEGSGEAVEFDPAQPDLPAALTEALGETFIRCDVVLRTVNDSNAPLYGVFTGPTGSWVVEGAQAGVERSLTARPATIAELNDLVAGIARRAVEAAALPDD